MNSHEPKYTINVVSKRTGLSTHVIRVWERRYGAVRPERTASNRRLYSDADIDRLRLLKAATAEGHAIGQIAGEDAGALESLLRWKSRDGAAPVPVFPSDNGDAQPAAEALFGRARAAAAALDVTAFEAVLLEAEYTVSRPVLIESIVAPLLTWMGEAWQTGLIQVAHEHAISASLRHFLSGLRPQIDAGAGAPALVVTTPPRQLHEMGAMLVAVTAGMQGWRVLYLGPDSPMADIAHAARASGAAAVALSIVYPADDPYLPRELRALRQYLPESTVILAGGAGARGYDVVLKEVGARQLADLRSFQQALDEIRLHGAHPSKRREPARA